MKNNKTYRYDPKKISIILVVGIFLLVLFVNKEYKESMRYAIMTCTSNFGAPEHTEVDTFKFLAKQNGVLYEFYRDETYTFENDEDLNKTFDYLVDYRNNMKDMIDTTNVLYDIKKKDKNIFVNTYIKVGTRAEVFNNYALQLGISKDSSAKEVYERMTTNDAYTCIETESK
jgi:hypothetical protein